MSMFVFCFGFFPKRNLLGLFVSIIPFKRHIFIFLVSFCFVFSFISNIDFCTMKELLEGETQIVGKINNTAQALFHFHVQGEK